jgi:hypothetical protein
VSNRNTDFENVLKWIVVVILAIFALKIVATVLGIAWFLGGFLITKILPLVVLMWLVMKAVQYFRGSNGSTSPTPPPSSF